MREVSKKRTKQGASAKHLPVTSGPSSELPKPLMTDGVDPERARRFESGAALCADIG